MKPTVRQRILAYLGRQPGASAAQVGRALDLSAPTVRHHLGLLRADGRIEQSGQQNQSGRGRPLKSYRVSEMMRGNNLEIIADSLLDAWPGKAPASRREGILGVVTTGLLHRLGASEAQALLPARIRSLLEKLNVLHYEARWEAGAEGPRILFGHCPYAAIIGRHPELCEMDARILGTRLQARAQQVGKIDQLASTPTHCVFVLR